LWLIVKFAFGIYNAELGVEILPERFSYFVAKTRPLPDVALVILLFFLPVNKKPNNAS